MPLFYSCIRMNYFRIIEEHARHYKSVFVMPFLMWFSSELILELLREHYSLFPYIYSSIIIKPLSLSTLSILFFLLSKLFSNL